MQAITTRCDLVKTQGALILHLCICIFLTSAAFAQSQAAKSISYHQKVRTFHTAEEFASLTKGSVKLYRKSNCDGCKAAVPGLALPIAQIPVYADNGQGVHWIGTSVGVIRHNVFTRVDLITGRPTGSQSDTRLKFEYFAGKRWLPDDQVTGIGFEKSPNEVVWVETPKGFSRIEYKPMTLAEKSQTFVERVRARHVRHGLTADSHLRIPGDLTSNQTVSSDNDGLWTQMYIAAEAFSYRVTGKADARANARQRFQDTLRFEENTSNPR